MQYHPSENRYDQMVYRKCGHSGLKLPAISLGLWHNFGEDFNYKTAHLILNDDIIKKAYISKNYVNFNIDGKSSSYHKTIEKFIKNQANNPQS